MTPIRLFIIIAATALVASCSGTASGDAVDSSAADTLMTSPETADSIGEIFGYLKGYDDRSARQIDADTDIQNYLSGIEIAVDGSTHSQAYTNGVELGLEMLRQLKQMEQSGVKVNRRLIARHFREVITADTVTSSQIDSVRSAYSTLFLRVK